MKIYKNSADLHFVGLNDSNSYSNGEYYLIDYFAKNFKVVLDVGANYGNWSKRILVANSNVEIHAFEPIPEVFSALKNSFENTPIILNNIALSDRVTTKKFFFYNDENNQDIVGMSTFYRRNADVEKGMAIHPLESTIATQTLDNYCEENNISNISFLKIDTEGSELDVINGGLESFSKGIVDMIQFEYGGTYQDAGITLKEIFEIFTRNKYRIFRIFHSGLIDIPEFSEGIEHYQYANYLAMTEKAVQSLESI